MAKNKPNPLIVVTPKTKKRLDKREIGKGDTYDLIIERMLYILEGLHR